MLTGGSGAGPPGSDAGFKVLETEHFRLVYDTTGAIVAPLVDRLEATYEAVRRFCEMSGLNPKAPASRLEVVLFDRYEDFAPYARTAGVSAASVAGFYDPESNTAAFCNVLDTPDLRRITQKIEQIRQQISEAAAGESECRQRPESRQESEQTAAKLSAEHDALADRFNRLVIQHEVAHQVLHNLGVYVHNESVPPWLLEGLACQFEGALPGELDGGTPGVNRMRLADLREALGVPPGARSVSGDAYAKALESGRFTPLVDLVSKPELMAKDDGNLAVRYAQSWALVHYLHHKDEKAFNAFVKYLRERSAWQPPIHIGPELEFTAFRVAFGEPDEFFQRQWLDYVLKLPFDSAKAGH